jgi:hypothetical protein
MMDRLEHHFKQDGFAVEHEPSILFGRADLGVYKKNHKDLLVEVGSVSLYKLLANLQTLNNAKILVVPTSTTAIEFEV